MKLLIFLNQSANTITKLKTIPNHQFLAAFAEILVIILERIRNHTENVWFCMIPYMIKV